MGAPRSRRVGQPTASFDYRAHSTRASAQDAARLFLTARMALAGDMEFSQ
jgi:hypothetical protein